MLYEPSLYVVREGARGNLRTDAIAARVITVDGDPSAGADLEGTCLGSVRCIVRRGVGPALETLTLALDERDLEATLRATPDAFAPAIWRLIDALDPATLFVVAGDTARGETFTQLPDLIAGGEVRELQPLTYFAARLPRACAALTPDRFEVVEARAGVGTLAYLASRFA